MGDHRHNRWFSDDKELHNNVPVFLTPLALDQHSSQTIVLLEKRKCQIYNPLLIYKMLVFLCFSLNML